MPGYDNEDFRRISKDYKTNRNVKRTRSETTQRKGKILKTIENEITAERIDYKHFIEKLPILDGKILTLFAEGYSLNEISKKLGLSYKYVKEIYKNASFNFTLEISSDEKNRLRIVRSALDITQEEIAKALGLTRDAFSKYERGHFEFADDKKKKMMKYIMSKVKAPKDFMDCRDKLDFEFQWNRAVSIFFPPNYIDYDLISENKNNSLNYVFFYLLEYYDLLHERQKRLLNSIIYVDVFAGFKGLNISMIKDYLSNAGKRMTYSELVVNMELVKAKGLKFSRDFNNVKKEFLKINKKRENAAELLGFFYSAYKSRMYNDKDFIEELFFGYPKIDKEKAKIIADRIKTFMK